MAKARAGRGGGFVVKGGKSPSANPPSGGKKERLLEKWPETAHLERSKDYSKAKKGRGIK